MVFCYFLLSITITSPTIDFPNENEIQNKIQYIKQEHTIDIEEKTNIIKELRSALQSISESKYSKKKIQEYQNIIDNFSSIIHQLHEENNAEPDLNNNNINIPNSNKLRQNLLQINQQLNNLDQELQLEQNILRSINDSLLLLPQQHIQAKKKLNEINQKISNSSTKKIISYLEQAQFIKLQTEKQTTQTKITELELAQISANNRQELSRLRIELLKNQYHRLENKLYKIHIQLHNIRKQETEQTIEEVEKLEKHTKKIKIFPINITQQLKINHHLSQSLKEQVEHINLITLQQQQTAKHTLQARQTLSRLLEQAQWINQSPELGATLRSQILKLPKKNIYQPQQLNNEITKLKNQRLDYEEKMNKLSLLSSQNAKNNQKLSSKHNDILNLQINTQKKLLNSLLTNCDIQIYELTKLKIAHEQFKEVMNNIEKTIHHYLFWIPDIHTINLSYPYKICQDLYLLLNTNTLNQLKSSAQISFTNNKKSSILFLILLLFICCSYTTYRNQYYSFLVYLNQKLKNTNNFSFILQNIFWSIIISTPIPILLFILGYNLSQIWEFPITSAIGEGITVASPILCLLMIFSYFSSNQGIFSICFKWNKNKTKKLLHNYPLHVTTIILLTIITTTLNHYNNKELYDTLGRLFFIILCISLTLITYNLKKINFPLYINKNNSSKNITNQYLLNIVIYFPIISAIFACFGYLETAQTLLIRLETSLIIGIISSIIYHTIQNWIMIQKQKISSKYNLTNKKNIIYTKQKNIKKKSLTSSLSQILTNTNTTISITSIIKKNISTLSDLDLNIISKQALRLIRTSISFTTLLIIFSVWSELHFIYEFLKKITILDVTSNLQNTHHIQPITIQTLLIIILILFITAKFTKYLPSLLILTILQHLNLTPGSNYAIIILIKHTLILLSIIICCSYLGIEWSKIQWLIAAIGVGLGFGLQEIFANFISGLIILFEKPIRIEDTITIGNFTGHVTQINTRATTITDWDHKEIIIPNKEFITKKFINWSLSDTTTRIVLKIPGPTNVSTTKIRKILLEATTHCPLVLHTPQPEVYLINLEKGIPLFEIRIYTANIKNRVLLKHQIHTLIIHFYDKNGLKLPFPHMQINQLNK